MPTGLNNEQFVEILGRCIRDGLVGNRGDGVFEWKASRQLLAYFAIRVSTFLRISKRDNAVASWKPFEQLFGVKAGTLRTKKLDWEKVGSHAGNPFRPPGWEKIEAVLNSNVK